MKVKGHRREIVAKRAGACWSAQALPPRREPHNPAMPYDVEMADRVRELLLLEPDVTEKRMFGGVSFLINGHIAVAVSGRGGLLMRVEDDEREALLAQPGVEPFTMRGRPLKGWAHVTDVAISDDGELTRWVFTGVELARALPAD